MKNEDQIIKHDKSFQTFYNYSLLVSKLPFPLAMCFGLIRR